MVTQKESQGRKKPKDLSVCESEERGCGEGGGVYATLMESDVVDPSGRADEALGRVPLMIFHFILPPPVWFLFSPPEKPLQRGKVLTIHNGVQL